MKQILKKMEHIMEFGGMKKDITLLVISGIALIISIFDFFQCPLMLHGLPLFFVESQSYWRR